MSEPLMVTPIDDLLSQKKDVNVKLYGAKSSSAYNLFYQYTQIIHNSIERPDEIPPSLYGLEDIDIESSPILMMASDEDIMRYRKGVIEQILQRNQVTERQKNNKTRNDQMRFAELSKQ